ncbi:MAG: AMIN domain-containing protein [Candidatus Rokubacteria bacterium]|nr:AMIN domain-containing protein [Candidatus Rokubacteria bacterium]
MTRRWLGGVALGLGLLLSGPASAPAGPAVVLAVFMGSHEGRFQLEILGSEPLDYVVIEGAEPFSVSLLLLNASFAFPPEERQLPGPGLTRIRTAVLEREGSRLGRLDLTFGKSAPFRVIKEGARLFVRVDTPPPPGGLALPAPGREPVATVRPAPAEPPARRTPPPPAPPALSAPPVPLILELRPEVVGDDVQVIIQADGPLAYKSFALDKPSRVVVDFERAQLAMAEEDTIEVDNAVLKRIRSSQPSPTSVRVVLDLARPRPFWIEPRAEGVVVHLGAARRP